MEKNTKSIDKIREVVNEMNFTTEFYNQLAEQAYPSQDEANIAAIKMKYAKEHILKKSFELKRLVKHLESHLQ